MCDGPIKPPTTSDNTLPLALSYIGNKTKAKFDGDCLKQDKTTFTHGKSVNIYIACKINLWNYVESSDPTLGNSLFGTIKLKKKTLILKNLSILEMVLDLIWKELLNFLL